ncbi:MAG: PAS domain S-box protein, partial [Williamsia sp.]|nr:PAS domain S-box protein [Williamsia sp.]
MANTPDENQPSQQPDTNQQAKPDTDFPGSEDKFRKLFESLDQAYCTVELIYDQSKQPIDLLYLEANPAFEKIMGYAPAGRKVSEIFGEVEPHWYAAYDRVLKSGIAERFDFPLEKTGGWYTVYISPMQGAASRQAMVVFDDITERKQHQEFLVKLNDALRPLADPVALQTTAMKLLADELAVMRATYFDVAADQDTFYLTARYERDAIPIPTQLRFSDFSPTLLNEYRTGRTLLVSDTEVQTQWEAYRAFGVRAWAAVPLVKNGQLLATIEVHSATPRDWTRLEVQLLEEVAERTWAAVERAKAEAAVLTKEAEFRTITQAAPALVWVCSATGENIYFNQRWYDYTGQTADDASGYGWTTTMHPDDTARILPYWQACQQSGEVYEGEVRYRRYDGAYRWHLFRALPRRNGAGQIQAWYGVSVDIEDAKQAQEALQLANRRKDEFLA